MSRWGVGSFENDDAAGWLAKLGPITANDLTKIFLHAADNPGYLEAPDASVAVAVPPPWGYREKLSNGRKEIERRLPPSLRLWQFAP